MNLNLFSFSSGNKNALKMIKKIIIEDRDYRNIAVLPFQNRTGNDYYDYISEISQKYLHNYLLNMSYIQIMSNDIIIPIRYMTNKMVKLVYPTNFRRDAVIISPEKVNAIYYRLPEPDDYSDVAKQVEADYIINNRYNFYKKEKEKFIVNSYVYNVAGKSNHYIGRYILNKDSIEKDIGTIANDIVKFFIPKANGALKVVSEFSNIELFIDNIDVGDKLYFENIAVGPHILSVRFADNRLWETNFKVETNKTLILYVTNSRLTGQTGALKVTTEPDGAEVSLDVKICGNSPIVITNLMLKSYRLEVKKEGYEKYFKNINLHSGTNFVKVKLKKQVSKEYRIKEHKRDKLLMYSFFGVGTISMLTTYYFYSKSENEYDRYLQSHSDKDLENYRRDAVVWLVSGTVGVVSLGVSFIYFLKVIEYDDVNIGMNDNGLNLAFGNGFSVFYRRRF